MNINEIERIDGKNISILLEYGIQVRYTCLFSTIQESFRAKKTKKTQFQTNTSVARYNPAVICE